MPNYSFKCSDCSKELVYYLTYKEMKSWKVLCPVCSFNIDQGKFMRRVLKATSTAVQTKEVIDNGLMPKRVERLAGVSEMVKQRADDLNDKS
jgi:DNA-directed RNA polymerase subunit RPC12/RpoP